MPDVVIVGGGITGASTAVELLSADATLDVVVVEPDPEYAKAATGKGTGGVRQLFTRPENIWLSQITLDIIDDWQNWAGAEGYVAPATNWRANGYLFIAGPEDADAFETNFEVQQRNGVNPIRFSPEELKNKYPEIQTYDLYAAALSERDGWFDQPTNFFQGILDKAKRLGARFVEDRVVEFIKQGTAIAGARLESGSILKAEDFVSAAGTWSAGLLRPLGVDLPVEPMKRHEHYIETGADLNHLPFIKDIQGLAVHAHRDGLSVGLVDFDHPGGEDLSIDPDYYPSVVEPALESRLPNCGGSTHRRTWTGLYDQNRFDGNMVIGNVPGVVDNLYFASGFSGHGFMHGPGVGRGLTELILEGDYTTLDLSRMSYQRILDNHPYPELGIR